MGKFDLRQKKVIDVKTAEVVGYIRDMEIDLETGRIKSVTIPGKGLFGILLPGKNTTVSWDSVVAIGSEFVIVKMSNEM